MDILLIDDEVSLRRTLRTTLESMGHVVAESASSDQALHLLQRQRFDAAFLDLRLGREAGIDLLPGLLREAPDLAVVVITAHATIASAVEATRRGAFDYLPKPFTPDQLRVTLERSRQMRRLRNQVADLQEQVRAIAPEVDLETAEPLMRQAVDLAFQAAASEATVLLRGESGTGKGVLARAMHARSPRAGGPFVTVHCPSLSAELLESELFGHARGAFTGAMQNTTGKVAAARRRHAFPGRDQRAAAVGAAQAAAAGCRTRPTSASAKPAPTWPTSASCRRRTATCPRRWRRAGSARTCTTG